MAYEDDRKTMNLVAGDLVRTKIQMYFVEARHPDTGDEIEVRFPRGHYLVVHGVSEEGVVVTLPGGYTTTLSYDDIEAV